MERRGDVFGISKQKLCAKGAKLGQLLNATGNLRRFIANLLDCFEKRR